MNLGPSCFLIRIIESFGFRQMFRLNGWVRKGIVDQELHRVIYLDRIVVHTQLFVRLSGLVSWVVLSPYCAATIHQEINIFIK